MMKAIEIGETSSRSRISYYSAPGMNRGVAILDFFIRVLVIIETLASAIAMGTTNQTLPLLNQFIRFRAKYTDLPAFTFFVAANSVVSVYLVFSLALSIFHILKGAAAQSSRIILIIFDTAMLGFLSAGASAAASIVYLAHKGNAKLNWFGICRQFNSFCDRISGSLIGSFAGVLLLILLILLSAIALSRRH